MIVVYYKLSNCCSWDHKKKKIIKNADGIVLVFLLVFHIKFHVHSEIFYKPYIMDSNLLTETGKKIY
jgi:hypothetical protein